MDDMDTVALACETARHMIDSGAACADILNHLVGAAETVAGNASVASILMLDGDGLLRNAASPNLPGDYLAAIDRLCPNPNLGTCAAAAATGSIVVTTDFRADDKWAELRHLPLALGFVGAWSMPIKSARTGHVLGTFGTYFREARAPSDRELQAIAALAAVAARALEQDSPC